MVTLLVWLGANAVVVAALTPVVWLLCRMLRSRPAVGHLLWFLLLLKLVAPPVVDWPWRIDLSRTSASTALRVTPPAVANTSAVLEDEGPFDPASELVDLETIAIPIASESFETASIEPRLSIESLAVIVWAIGVAALLGFMLVGLWRQRQIVRNAAIAPEHLVSVVGRIARHFGVRPPRVIVCERITTPAICCLGRPTLIWPATMNARNVVADCQGVVAHELAHLARRDHYFLYAEFVVMLCCWWNPLVWLIRRRLCETRELACDARALAAVDQPRGDYAQRLLNLSVSRPSLLLVAPAFGAGTLSRRFLKRRLIMVFDERVHGRTSLGGILLAFALIAVGLPGITLADVPGESDAAAPAEAGAPATAETPATAAAPAQAAATASAGQSAASSASADSDATVAGTEEPRTTTRRATRILQVIKSGDINAEKSVDISLDSGATIRISKNQQGDLLVAVDQTEVSELPRRRRIIVDRTGAEDLARTAPSSDAVTTTRRVIGSSSTATSASPRMARSTSVSSADFDREMLQSEVELAEVNLMEQRAKMEIVRKAATAGSISEGELILAELGVRRAEIELRRAKLKLARGESPRPQR
jgi:beta-lactamase regulating signal transducer with metallopeptidase domain